MKGGKLMDSMITVKYAVLAGIASVGTLIVHLLGGWDIGLETLLIFMTVDYITGFLVAGFFHHSPKSEDGRLSSKAGFKGLCKKGATLLVVLIGTQLDSLLGENWARSLILFFFVANEGLSILENLGMMGVPFPSALQQALTLLRDKNDSNSNEDTKA